MKIAKLVTFSITTRVIVDANDSDDVAIELAKKNVQNAGDAYFGHDYVGSIEEDKECPYGTFENEK